MVKADDNVVFDEEHPEKFTEFEYIKARVSHIERVLEQHADILIDNNLVLTKENKAAYIDEDEIFDALAGK